jgi:hypothetical protein
MDYLTKNGVRVVIQGNHMLAHTDVLPLLPEVLEKIDTNNRTFIKMNVDLGRIVGHTICVPTTEQDEIVYARRPGRNRYSRFVKNREPIPTQTVAVLLRRIGRDTYRLVSSWIGTVACKEPTDRSIVTDQERMECIAFWNRHALIWSPEEIA